MKILLKQIARVLRDRAAYLKALNAALPLTGLDTAQHGTIQFIFLPRTQMADLNGMHLHHSGATDVITYDLRDDSMPPLPGESADSTILAEIYICPAIAEEFAQQCNTTLSHELFLYAVHGMLHLAGEDDLTDEARVSMRAAEKRVLNAVAVAGFDLDTF